MWWVLLRVCAGGRVQTPCSADHGGGGGGEGIRGGGVCTAAGWRHFGPRSSASALAAGECRITHQQGVVCAAPKHTRHHPSLQARAKAPAAVPKPQRQCASPRRSAGVKKDAGRAGAAGTIFFFEMEMDGDVSREGGKEPEIMAWQQLCYTLPAQGVCKWCVVSSKRGEPLCACCKRLLHSWA